MSDSTERNKNERLTAREIEEEEMKRELSGLGIYEPELTYKDMKKIIGFLNESEDVSKTASNNKNIQKENMQHSNNECLSEMTPETDVSSQDVIAHECTEVSKSAYSCKLNRTSPTITHERKTVHYSGSPESPSIFHVRNSVYRHKSPDSEETTEKQHENANCTHSSNRFISKLGNVSRECQNTAETKEMQDAAQSEYNQRLERWRMNPLDVCINENDVPLRQPRRTPAQERTLFEYCKKAHIPEQRDQAVQKLSQHLKEIAELGCSWRRPAESKFQWGSPIQVGTANGSLDRKPLTEPKTDESFKTECTTYRGIYERASKRKANTLITNLNKESSSEDEDDQYDFARVKKKKIPSDSKLNNQVNRTNQNAQTNKSEKTTSNVIACQQQFYNDDNSNINFDSEDDKIKRQEKTNEENERLSPELVTYPRRIIPPNPKARASISRLKRGNVFSKPFRKKQRIDEDEDIEQKTKNLKKDNTLADEEICRILEEDSDEKETAATAKKDVVEIRPLPISKEIRSKLQDKRLSANVTQRIREAKPMSREKENNKERNKEFGEERKRDEKLRKIENRNVSWERQLMSDNEDESSETNCEPDKNDKQCGNIISSTNNVSCPICNKLFPHDEIEDHAADCEQFETNNEEDSNDMDQFKCNICDKYKTNNGNEYEQHVHECISSKNDKKHLRGSKDTDVITKSIPSSFCNLKTDNQHKNSKINQMDQSSFKIFTSKNRKH